MPETYDLAVIGGGPGGYAAALYGAGAGLRVALVERDTVGGTCLNRGCIPAKELLQTAEVYRTVMGAKEFGVEAGVPRHDRAAAVTPHGRVGKRRGKGLGGALKHRGVDVHHGHGRLASPTAVTVEPPPGGSGSAGGPATIEAAAVVVAAGSVPRTIPGFDFGGVVVSSDAALFLDALPDSVAIVGAGAIGCEFASCFADVGVQVFLLEALDGILPGVDAEVAAVAHRELKKRGVDVRTGARITGHRPSGNGAETLAFVHGGEGLEVDVELVLVAVGRRPRTEDSGLAECGVSVDESGFVSVDRATMRTNVAGVWAVGDCVDTPALAHVAFAEGMVAVRDVLGQDPEPVQYAKVPWGIYCHPEVAFCGMTEEAARAAGHDVAVARSQYAANGRAVILGETRGMVKMISDDATGELLGVHMVGPWATEGLVEGYLALNWEATAADLARLVHPHPTLSEIVGETAMALAGRPLHG